MPPAKTITVEQNEPLLDFLLKNLAGFNRNTVKHMLKYGSVLVNGSVVTRHSYELGPGDQVRVEFTKKGNPLNRLAPAPFEIIYEDDDLLAINKPAGLLSVASENEKVKTAFHELNEYLASAKHAAHEHAFVVHRLDGKTSGILLFAKNHEAKSKLLDNWKNFTKIYLAVVEGTPKELSGTIKSHLLEDEKFKMRSQALATDATELAITHYRVLKSAHDRSLVEVTLETGKKNQIRVHMADIGNPVVGDEKYGAKTNPVKRLALHAWRLSLEQPTTGERITLESTFPGILKKLV